MIGSGHFRQVQHNRAKNSAATDKGLSQRSRGLLGVVVQGSLTLVPFFAGVENFSGSIVVSMITLPRDGNRGLPSS